MGPSGVQRGTLYEACPLSVTEKSPGISPGVRLPEAVIWLATIELPALTTALASLPRSSGEPSIFDPQSTKTTLHKRTPNARLARFMTTPASANTVGQLRRSYQFATDPGNKNNLTPTRRARDTRALRAML
jgi:hypothetical protein